MAEKKDVMLGSAHILECL